MCGLYAIAYHFYLRRAVTANATCYPGATRTHTRGRNRTSGVNGYKPYPITTWVLSHNRPSAVSTLFIVLLKHYSVRRGRNRNHPEHLNVPLITALRHRWQKEDSMKNQET